MNIQIISLFPEMFCALKQGIVGRAITNQLVNVNIINPRDYTNDPHRTVDDRPYGGGPGMVMKYEPLHAAIQDGIKKMPAKPHVMLLSPQGKPLEQSDVAAIAQLENIMLICGRYEGVDQRLIESDIDAEISIGDFVVSGGELPAMLLIDAATRLLPGALGDAASAEQDSFATGLLDHPHYTRPECIHQQAVPKVLLSGDHQAITRWRLKQSLGKTWQKRPDLIKRRILTADEKQLLDEYIKEAAKGAS